MKRTSTYLLALLALCMASCTKTATTPVTTSPSFKGTYSGNLTRLHENLTTRKLDTLTSGSLVLKLDSLGAFTITGDTATVHAGSFGQYALGYRDDLIFTDKTLPATGTPAKIHLSGDYTYATDGSVLELQKIIGDSVSYTYYFTKSAK